MRRQNPILASLLISSLSCLLCAVAAADEAHEKLLNAIRDGDLTAASILLSAGANANAHDEDGLTALMYAAIYADADCMRLLLSKGADPRAKSKGEMTALMLAVGDARKVRLLLAKGAEVNAKSKQGHTALILAASRAGSLEVIKLLLAQGASLADGNCLGAAARIGDIQVIRYLLEKGADPNSNKTAGGPGPASEKRLSARNIQMALKNATPLLGLTGSQGATALMLAAHARNTEAARLLLSKGADVNAINNVLGGGTALMLAAKMGDLETVRLLLQKGAAVNLRHASGYTALMYAAGSESNDPELIKALLRHGADASIKGNDGETAPTLAGKKGKIEIVRLLEQAIVKE